MVGILLNLLIALRNIDGSKILSFSIYKYNMFSHLFRLSFIFYVNIFWVLVYKFSTYLVKFVPRCFIPFFFFPKYIFSYVCVTKTINIFYSFRF